MARKSPDDPLAERLAWLRLYRGRNIGPTAFRQLLLRYGSAGNAVRRLTDLPSEAEALQEYERAQAVGADLLLATDAAYSALLAQAPSAPPVLYARGRMELLSRPAVAVVGARNASALGVRFARELAAGLAAADLVVVSGLARGIDAAAHQGALTGGTIAVLGTGIDVAFPPENRDLYASVAEQGLLLSEYPPGAPPTAANFPRRNRIIAGLALGVVVVEGAIRSGSLGTAALAADYGREVMAVPGSPLDPRAAGPNSLLKKGALLVEQASDVVEALRPLAGAVAPLPAPTAAAADWIAPDDLTEKVAALLGPAPVEADELGRQTGLSPPQLAGVLLDLELAGRARRHPGNRISTA